MSIKERFIKDLINELNDINERQLEYNNKPKLNVCWCISVLDQQLEHCYEFINTITKYNYLINGYEEPTPNKYNNGRIRVLIEKPEEEMDCSLDTYYNYCYYIEFTFDERSWGYCECTPKDIHYNAEHGCCGCGCDWTAPAVKIIKEEIIGCFEWSGYEKDYWEYEKKFKIIDSNNNEENERLEKEKIRICLEEQIAELQERIKQL